MSSRGLSSPYNPASRARPVLPREYQFPARRAAKFPDTSIYFPGAIKSTCCRRRRRRRNLHSREERRDDEGARRLINLLAGDRNVLLFRVSDTAFRDTDNASRKWLRRNRCLLVRSSTRSPARFDVRQSLILPRGEIPFAVR